MPFPGSLCLAAALADMQQAIPLEQERGLHATALPARRQESLAARALARQALRRLGGPPVAIGRDPQGAPQWPTGWAGGLSHAGGMAAALVGPAASFAALGVDIEAAGALPQDAAAIALDSVERRALENLPGGYARWSRAVFAAKECVHKCVHPLRGAWLEFDEVRVHLDADDAGFRIEALSDAARAACVGIGRGSLLFAEAHVLAALAIERPG